MSAEVLKTELVQVGQDSLQVVRQSGHGWVLLKPTCDALGIDHSGQMQRLKFAPWATVSVILTVGADGRNREMSCLRSDRVAMWLATIDTSRLANDEARAKLVMWQCEAADVLDRWARGKEVPTPTKVAAPDLNGPLWKSWDRLFAKEQEGSVAMPAAPTARAGADRCG